MTKAKKKLTSVSGELMEALNITPDDLAANNDGYISDHQREALSEPMAGSHGNHYAVGFLLMMIALGILVVGGGLSLLFSSPTDGYTILIGTGILLGVSIFIIFLGRRKRYALIDELERNEFATMQGIAIVQLDDNTSKFEINDVMFKPDRDIVLRIKHLEPYLIHYLPESKTILSMEHIPDNPNLRSESA